MSAASKVENLLIVLMGSVGDVARGLALVEPLKNHFPGGHLTWLVEPACAELVRLHPLVDRILIFDRPRGLAALRTLVRELRSQRYDIALDLQRHFKSGCFTWLSQATRRIGFHRRDSKEWNWIFQNTYISRHGEEHSKLVQYLDFLRTLGVHVPDVPDFGIESRVREVASPLACGPYVVLVMGSRWSSKDWPLSGYQQLGRMIIETRAEHIVLVGAPSHKASADSLVASFHSKRVHNLVGATSIPELARIILDAKVTVGPDSGPGHIAAALGRPYVALFGATSAKRTAPYGSEHLVVRAEIACAPCYRRRCPGLNTLCMRLISAAAVKQRIEPFLGAAI